MKPFFSANILYFYTTKTKICTIIPVHPHSRKDFLPANTPFYLSASDNGSTPSILWPRKFRRYVVTRFLPDADFHGHRPAVFIYPNLSFRVPSFGSLAPSGFIPSRQSCLPETALLCAFYVHCQCSNKPSTISRYSKFVHEWSILYILVPFAHTWPCGHFERNQQPDCSIGLSPLYQTHVNELHINTTNRLHLTFVRLRSCLA